MAKKLEVLYPGKTDVDGNNQFGTFKNRTSDTLKDGTPYEKGWASDVWGFLAHILKKAVVTPSGAEENETVSQYYDALEGLVGRRDVKFESEDLLIDLKTTETVDVNAKRLSLLDSNFIPKFINDLDVTFTMPTDLEAGTSEKPSHNYGLWLDSDENLRLVPDLTGSTDSTVAGFLADSAATLLTDLVKAGDIARNRTTGIKTTISVDAVANGQVAVTDDIFTSGDSYEIIKLSPEGLGANRERVGSAFNDSGSDLVAVLKNGKARITTAFWHTINGYGSSSDKIQKFTTEVDESNDVIVTIINSATLGFVITANMSCKLSISYMGRYSASGQTGLSKNSNQLTTGIGAIIAADRLAHVDIAAADRNGFISWSGELEKGDVIRPHGGGTTDGNNPERTSIHVLAIEII